MINGLNWLDLSHLPETHFLERLLLENPFPKGIFPKDIFPKTKKPHQNEKKQSNVGLFDSIIEFKSSLISSLHTVAKVPASGKNILVKKIVYNQCCYFFSS